MRVSLARKIARTGTAETTRIFALANRCSHRGRLHNGRVTTDVPHALAREQLQPPERLDRPRISDRAATLPPDSNLKAQVHLAGHLPTADTPVVHGRLVQHHEDVGGGDSQLAEVADQCLIQATLGLERARRTSSPRPRRSRRCCRMAARSLRGHAPRCAASGRGQGCAGPPPGRRARRPGAPASGLLIGPGGPRGGPMACAGSCSLVTTDTAIITMVAAGGGGS
jgi:hypothetical protein